jgi:two-component system LytT family response regulator
MEKLRCIAIDDEPLALRLVSGYIEKFAQLELLQVFEDAISAAEYLRKTPVDLLFIDINMPDITGIDLVRSLDKRPIVIFVTAYKNFAFEGFELEAIDYLLKPVDFTRFERAVEKAIDYHKYKIATPTQQQEENIYVYSEYRMIRINLAEVEYIESMEDYIKIHLVGGKVILTLMPLKKMLEKLPADKFQRIHRSYIVAVNQIKSIQNKKAQLPGAELPISDSYVDFVRSWRKAL